MTRPDIQHYGRGESCPICVAVGADQPAKSRCAWLRSDDGGTLYLCASAEGDVPGFRCVGDDNGTFLGARRFVAEDGRAPPPDRERDHGEALDGEQAQAAYESLVELVREHAHVQLPQAQAEVARRGLQWTPDFLAPPSTSEVLDIIAQLHDRHPALNTRGLRGLHRSKGYLHFPSPASLDGELWIVLRDFEGRVVSILRRLLGTITDRGGKYRLMGPARAAFVGTTAEAVPLLVAEGPIKAMIAAERLGVRAAATPGVVIARAVHDDVRVYLERVRPVRVLLAPDAGDLRKGHPEVERAVRRPWRKLARVAESVGAEVRWGWWQTEKGIDDAMVAGVAVEWLTWDEYVAHWANAPIDDDDEASDDRDAPVELPGTPEPILDAETAAAREILCLDDARARVRELIDEASRRGESLDISGGAGIGKSFAARYSEIDRLTALHGTERGHGLTVFMMGAGLDLVREQHAAIEQCVRELGAAEEIAVRIGLGRQPVQSKDGEPTQIPPNSPPSCFGCVNFKESANRSRGGFHGCAGCQHAPGGPVPSMCESTPGAYLHDWAALRTTATSGPTIIVLHSQSLHTYWSKVGRAGPNVRFYADDCDDVHGGLLHEFVLAPDVLEAAQRTAELGVWMIRRESATPGRGRLAALIARSTRCDSLGQRITTAAPELVAWILAAVLQVIRPKPGATGTFPRRDRLGAVLLALAGIEGLRDYVLAHTFGRDLAWKEHKRLGPNWGGLGIGALIWSLFRSLILHGNLPTVENRGEVGSAIVSIDLRLVDAIRAGRVTRLGVAPLPAFARVALGFHGVREIVVSVRAPVIAVKHPRRSSWGKRAKKGEPPTLADRYAAAIADDLAAAHPGRTLMIGGLADEARDPRDYEVAVSGRDDRATNKFVGEIDALVLRRLAYPMQAVLATVSALLAGLGLPRPIESEDGSLPMSRTPSGARLPLDERVREAWLAIRCSAVRNGIGRARAVLRADQVRLIALDQDLERWPDLILPGHRVATCSMADLPERLGIRMSALVAARTTERKSHDPDPARSTERQNDIARAEAAGANSIRAVAEATGIPRETVRRTQIGHDRPTVPLEDISLRELWVSHVRSLQRLAQLSRFDVVYFASVCGVAPRTVQRWRIAARGILADGTADRQTLAALDRALPVLVDFIPTPPRVPRAKPGRRRRAAAAPATEAAGRSHVGATPNAASPRHDAAHAKLDVFLRALRQSVRPDNLPSPASLADRLSIGTDAWRMPRATARRTVSRLLVAIAADLRSGTRAASRRDPMRLRRLADVAWAILELRPSAAVAPIGIEATMLQLREILEASDLTIDGFVRALTLAAPMSAAGPAGVVMAAFRETVAAEPI